MPEVALITWPKQSTVRQGDNRKQEDALWKAEAYITYSLARIQTECCKFTETTVSKVAGSQYSTSATNTVFRVYDWLLAIVFFVSKQKLSLVTLSCIHPYSRGFLAGGFFSPWLSVAHWKTGLSHPAIPSYSFCGWGGGLMCTSALGHRSWMTPLILSTTSSLIFSSSGRGEM